MNGAVMLDVSGTELTAEDRRRLGHPQCGAVILFTRNFSSRAQLRNLIAEIRSIAPHALIAVDHEGGRVQRFRSEFTRLPPMRLLGTLWDADPAEGALVATRAATAVGYVLARELQEVGIDLSFTPVLDLDEGKSQVIGDRAFHSDPRVVTLLAKSLCHGLALAGMGSCGKHFPGHGAVEADSHVALPVDERPAAAITGRDVLPYQWLGLALHSVMMAHVVYPDIDTLPASFSHRWITEVLRTDLGFQGAVFSDDLSMEGAKGVGDVVAAGRLALDAGCDMLIVCNAPESADRLLAGIDPSFPGSERIRRLPRAPRSVDLGADPVYHEARARVVALAERAGLS